LQLISLGAYAKCRIYSPGLVRVVVTDRDWFQAGGEWGSYVRDDVTGECGPIS